MKAVLGERKTAGFDAVDSGFQGMCTEGRYLKQPSRFSSNKELWLLSGLPFMSSLELLPAHLCLSQQNLRGWSCRQPGQQGSTAAFEDRLLFKKED